jgi:hypothetical protein
VLGNALVGATRPKDETKEKRQVEGAERMSQRDVEGAERRSQSDVEGAEHMVLTGTVVSISVLPSATMTSAKKAFVTSPTSPTSVGGIRTGTVESES